MTRTGRSPFLLLALNALLLAACAPAATRTAPREPLAVKRALRPLELPSPVPNSREFVHPSIVAFPDEWNGYRYWLAATPYPASNDSFENPSVLASRDGREWVVPHGAANPLFTPPPGRHYSDPDLVVGKDGNTLEIVWRQAIPGPFGQLGDVLLHASSRDGRTWSSPAVALDLAARRERGVSPAVVWNGERYLLWYCAFDRPGRPIVLRSAPSLDGPWSEPQETSLGTIPNEQVPWHLDVVPVTGGYRMLLNTSLPGRSAGRELWLLSSPDGLRWQVPTAPFLAARHDGWDARLYRSTLLAEETADGIRYRIWYGSTSGVLGWRIGYTETTERR